MSILDFLSLIRSADKKVARVSRQALNWKRKARAQSRDVHAMAAGMNATQAGIRNVPIGESQKVRATRYAGLSRGIKQSCATKGRCRCGRCEYAHELLSARPVSNRMFGFGPRRNRFISQNSTCSWKPRYIGTHRRSQPIIAILVSENFLGASRIFGGSTPSYF